MKSEHRHELQENELGRLADKVVGKTGSLLDIYGNQVMIAVCGISVIAAALIYYYRTTTATQANAWSDLFQSQKAEGFQETAARYKGTPIAVWAKLREGESRLATGVELMFTDRTAGMSELKQGQEVLEGLLSAGGIPREVRERALFVLAGIEESQAQPKTLEAAVGHYEQLLKEYPKSVYAPVVEQRLKSLKSSEAKEFYAWFAKQQPKPKPVEKKPVDQGLFDDDPHGGLGGGSRPNLGGGAIPSALDLTPRLDGNVTPKPATPVSPDETKPADKPEDKPATDEKPATKPTDEPKPADATKPADDKKPAEPKADAPKPAAGESKPEKDSKPEQGTKPDQPASDKNAKNDSAAEKKSDKKEE